MAHNIGLEKKDYKIMLARGRHYAESMVSCCCRLTEGIVDSQTSHFSEQAEIYAREAVEHARKTQNRRLLARVHVWHAHWFSLARGDLDGARELPRRRRRRCCAPLRRLCMGWDDLDDLKKRVMRAGSVDPLLRDWSQGLVNGAKSFTAGSAMSSRRS